MANESIIKLFEGNQVRIFWNEQEEKYYFAVADIVQVLTDSADVKQYIQRKSRMQEQFDQDFISIAPMLIKDYRDLNDKTYTNLVVDSLNWSQRQWAIISKVKTTMQKAVAPKVTIVDESNGGTIEKDIPLNFHGGLKSILLDTTALEDEFGF